MSSPTVVLLGTLDTKGREYEFVRQALLAQGVAVTLIDAGVLGTPLAAPDIDRHAVAAAAGENLDALAAAGDRGGAIDVMARGATAVVSQLHADGKLDAILGLGGSGGSTLVSTAMRGLPVGVPKLLVSTVAAGDTRPYVGDTDLTMMYSVVDISGLNRLSERILTNAAGAAAGMAKAASAVAAATIATDETAGKPLVAATMFGVTTPAVTTARERLEALGYEVLVFHATGTGGDTMESLVEAGYITAVLDLTTTELADSLAGGSFGSGPRRLEVAGAKGVPQVVSLGALDMVNFGPIESVPAKYQDRQLFKHNATITLMRTSPEENAQLGEIIARKLNQAAGPVALFIPLQGVSLIATAGGPFFDAAADAALIDALRQHIDPAKVEVHEIDAAINDPAFATAMADKLHEYVAAGAGSAGVISAG